MPAIDHRAILDTLAAIGEASRTRAGFAREGVSRLGRLVASEVTTLSIFDLRTGLRSVVTSVPGAIPPGESAAFAMAAPIHVCPDEQVSFVFSRSRRDFGERERGCVESIRPHLGHLYRLSREVDEARAAWGVPVARIAPAREATLTDREREVLHWLGAGKTDRDIGTILGISARTVQKHLQRVYEKLGVETRTAAVARAFLPREAA